MRLLGSYWALVLVFVCLISELPEVLSRLDVSLGLLVVKLGYLERVVLLELVVIKCVDIKVLVIGDVEPLVQGPISFLIGVVLGSVFKLRVLHRWRLLSLIEFLLRLLDGG